MIAECLSQGAGTGFFIVTCVILLITYTSLYWRHDD